MNSGSGDSGWYYAARGTAPGQESGPFTWEQLVAHADAGHLTREHLVWNERTPDWLPATQIPGLFAGAPLSPPAPPAPSAYSAPRGADEGRRRSRTLYWLMPVVALIVVGAALAAYFLVWYDGRGTDLDSLAFGQREGEVFCEPAGVAGPGSFTDEQFVTQGPTTTFVISNPTITLPPIASATEGSSTTGGTTGATSGSASATSGPPVTVEGAVVMVSYPGDTPALYGGSKSKLISDKTGELAFFAQHPEKAAAFCEALNGDPTFRWSGGTQVTPAQLPEYFKELTPLLLTRDTRVTNYGYKNGHPTPRQSLLQAGQLVLVDAYGVPRKRCECGNPLTPPVPSKKKPTYTGINWGTNPGTIIVIQPTRTAINGGFTVIDPTTGQPFTRPVGTEGPSDGYTRINWGNGEPPSDSTSTTVPVTDTTVTVPATDTTTTTEAVTTTAPQYKVYKLEAEMTMGDASNWHITWGGEITINPDGSLTGDLPGAYDADVDVGSGAAHVGTYHYYAPFGVKVSGTAESSADGRTLHIQQTLTGFKLTVTVVDGGMDPNNIPSDTNSYVTQWITEALTNLVLPANQAPVYGSAVAGRWQGSVNIIPVR
jgi:hypothetical protein